MDRFVAILFLLLTTPAFATTYYVRTDGDNGNAGTTDSAGGAWRNVYYAAHTDSGVSAGDLVIIKSGFYNESVTNLVSGSAGNPITFVGERGGSGEWLTIIDRSASISNGWVDATAWIGAGVWAYTNTFITRELHIDTRRVGFVSELGTISTAGDAYNGGPTTGVGFLTLAEEATLDLVNFGTVNFFDDIGALWGATNNVTYLRLPDGSNPDGLPVRASPNSVETQNDDTKQWGIGMSGKSYIVYSNLWVRSAFAQFYLTGDTHHVTLSSNLLTGGYCRVDLWNGARENLVQNNSIYGNFYGGTNTGAWETAATITNAHYYRFSKYIMSDRSTTWEIAMRVYLAGNSNVITGNLVQNGIGTGIQLSSSAAVVAQDTIVSSNVVRDFPSVGIHSGVGHIGLSIYDNTILDCTSSFRMHDFYTTGETSRLVYFYRNKAWLLSGVGSHLQHNWAGDDFSNPSPVYWIYQNSLSGGNNAIQAQPASGIAPTNSFIINNIIDSPSVFITDTAAGRADPDWWGAFDYNLIYPASALARAWMDVNNITNTGPEWVSEETMSFALEADSLARDAALDVHVQFTVNDETHNALPDNAIKTGSAWDIGALEFGTNSGVANIFGAGKVYH